MSYTLHRPVRKSSQIFYTPLEFYAVYSSWRAALSDSLGTQLMSLSGMVEIPRLQAK